MKIRLGKGTLLLFISFWAMSVCSLTMLGTMRTDRQNREESRRNYSDYAATIVVSDCNDDFWEEYFKSVNLKNAVHYAGVACEMDTIMDIARRHNLMVVEDAAQGVMSTYKGRALGTIGDFGCYSFHETKNYSMGEGGAIIINNSAYIEKAEILREKGTNRSQFFRGQVAKYNWVDFGDSYLQSDLNAAYLWAQLEVADEINENRLASWNKYYKAFEHLMDRGVVELPTIPEGCVHNAHMFYLKCKNLETRQAYIKFMRENDILCVFHYVPLHSAPAGLKFGRFEGEDEHTTDDSDRLVRLPMYYNLSQNDIKKVIDKTLEFFE